MQPRPQARTGRLATRWNSLPLASDYPPIFACPKGTIDPGISADKSATFGRQRPHRPGPLLVDPVSSESRFTPENGAFDLYITVCRFEVRRVVAPNPPTASNPSPAWLLWGGGVGPHQRRAAALHRAGVVATSIPLS